MMAVLTIRANSPRSVTQWKAVSVAGVEEPTSGPPLRSSQTFVTGIWGDGKLATRLNGAGRRTSRVADLAENRRKTVPALKSVKSLDRPSWLL